MKKYPKEIEEKIEEFYKSLSEKERRRYAGLEAIKLGYGGVSYIFSNFKVRLWNGSKRAKRDK